MFLDMVSFHYFPNNFGFGINLAFNKWFKRDGSREKVSYLFVAINIICWQIALNIPVKIYGIRK